MNTVEALNDGILKVSEAIQEFFPELSKYMDETPLKGEDTYTQDPDADHLQDYYDSLGILLTKYKQDHVPQGKDQQYTPILGIRDLTPNN